MIDEKALSSAMEAYSPQTQSQPDRGRLARAIAAYLESAKPKEAEGQPASRQPAPMADVILRLRHREASYRVSGPRVMADMLEEAADEIESLRAMLSAAGER
jgi:hypothetical protein